MAKIILTFKQKTLKEILLKKDHITIGRDPDNDIQVDNLAVSRFHAKIVGNMGVFYIEDLNSINGTFVNEKRVSKTSNLNNGDKITIGKHTLIFIEQKTDYEDLSRKTPDIYETIRIDKK